MIHIDSKENCCGCNACVQICPKNCISMVEDEEGFLYPQVNNEICIDCHLCEKVCPVINKESAKLPLKVYASKNKNEEVRMNSSSGGVFSLLAQDVINTGGVVFGARFNENWKVIHDYTETEEGLVNFRGSKYVQSNIGRSFIEVKQFLLKGKTVLFSGTPCQVAGLNRFLRKEYPNLLTVECLCHGVPSPLVWEKYLNGRKKTRKIDAVIFRDKRQGWMNYNFTLKFNNGVEETEKAAKNIYMRGFLSDLYLRPCCHKCPVKLGRSNSDLTIADFWNINETAPEFNDNKGVSLVLANTVKGRRAYLSLELDSIEVDFSSARKMNGGFVESIQPHKKRYFFFEKLHDCDNLDSLISECIKLSYRKRIRNIIRRVVKKILK